MADILSQDELDALLGQMQGDDDEPDDEVAADVAEIEEAFEASADIPPDPGPYRPEAPVAAGFDEAAADQRNIHLILSIPIELQVELGRTAMTIHELMQLGQGSVIELDKLAGEPLNVLVHGRLIARGEAVVVNDKFGVRLTDIVSPNQRVLGLQD